MALHTPNRASVFQRQSAVLAPVLSVLIAAGISTLPACGGNAATEQRSQDPLAETAGDTEREHTEEASDSADDSRDSEQGARGSDSPIADADDATNSANLNPVSEDPSASETPAGLLPDSEHEGAESGDVEDPVVAPTDEGAVTVTEPGQACPSPPTAEAAESPAVWNACSGTAKRGYWSTCWMRVNSAWTRKRRSSTRPAPCSRMIARVPASTSSCGSGSIFRVSTWTSKSRCWAA